MRIEEFLEIVAPPERPVAAGGPGDWPEVESAIGTALPDDYKALVNVFGAGYFGTYLNILTPFVEWPDIWNLVDQIGEFSHSYGESQRINPEFHPTIPAFPAPGGLLMWGRDYDGGALCWRTRGTPSEWTIVSLDNHYSQAIVERAMTVTEFIAATLAGKMPKIFPLEDDEDEIETWGPKVFVSPVRTDVR